MSVPLRIIKYQYKLDCYAFIIQLPVLFMLPFLFKWHPLALTLLIFCYTNGGFLLWKRNAIPEMVFHRGLYYLLILPYFIWTGFCMLFLIPALFFAGWLLIALFFLPHELPVFFYHALSLCALICLAFSLYGGIISPKWIRETRISLHFAALPQAFNHYRLIQLSDLHIGNFTSCKTLRRLRKQVAKLKPDLIVITGDILTFGDTFMESTVDELKEFTKICPVIICGGNHEYFVDFQKLQLLFKAASLDLLDNDYRTISKGNQAIYIAGIIGVVDKLDQQIEFINQSLKDIPENGFKILLSHEGTVFDYSVLRGIQLTLSGHTHGGQVAFPFWPRLNFSSFRYPYNSGLYSKNNHHLYVSRGIGCIHFYFRLFCPPEITLFELNCIDSVGVLTK